MGEGESGRGVADAAGGSCGLTSRVVGIRVRSPFASRHSASHVAAMAVTAREYESEPTPNTGER